MENNNKLLLDPTNKLVLLNDEPIGYGKAIELTNTTRIKRDRKDHLIIETQDFELDVTLVTLPIITYNSKKWPYIKTFTGHDNCVDKYCPHIDFSVSLKDNYEVLAHADHDFGNNENSELNNKEIKIDAHGLLGLQ